MGGEISELIEDWVASLPEVYYKLREAMDDPDCTFEDYGEIIRSDTALSARLLKLVNSSFYGFPTEVGTISHALSIIGTDQLTDLVLATAITREFRGIPKDLVDMESFWRHSIACGLAAKQIAALQGRSNFEHYFLGGLLHDIGKLVMFKKIPDEIVLIFDNFRNIPNQNLYEVEQRVIGYDHAQVGGALLEQWRLPHDLVRAVNYHHTPAQAGRYFDDAATVNLANALVLHMGLGIDSSEDWDPDPKSLESFHLGKDSLEALSADIRENLDQILRIFL